MKKIAIFQKDLNYGGIEKSLINLLNNLDYTKCKADLYLVDKGVFFDELNPNVTVYKLPKMLYINRMIPFKLLLKLYRFKCDKKYDLAIDFNSYSQETACAAVLCNAKEKVSWIHNDVTIKSKNEFKYRILHLFFKGKYQYFDTFVSVSTGALEGFMNLNHIKNKKSVVIPNIIDTAAIFKQMKEPVEDVVVDPKKINLISVGRITYQKGFDILINNYQKVIKKNRNYHLYIIGDGKDMNALKLQIKDLKLEHYVTILGYQKNPYKYINMMDAFVLTSRYEGQGMVFLEASSIGISVIMPKHLEKYVDGEIKGEEDIVNAILSVKKSSHKTKDLKKYNQIIIKKFENL